MGLPSGILRNVRNAMAVGSFLRHTITPEEAGAFVDHELATRNEAFLRVVEEGVYANPKSPYLRLLRHAGIEFGEIRRLVSEVGLEGTLSRLYDAGVYVRQEEFKGREPIRRDGIEFEVKPEDFNSPLARKPAFERRTSGSTGTPGRQGVSFEKAYDEAAFYMVMRASEFGDRPLAIWDDSNVRRLLRFAKIGRLPDKYFVTTAFQGDREGLERWFQRNCAALFSRLLGRPLPRQETVTKDQAVVVARWLAEMTARGTPAAVEAHPSPAIRVCLAAREHDLDISGTLFTMGGEPFTPGKAAVMASVGAEPRVRWSMAEVEHVSAACAKPAALDDVHMLPHHSAMIQRDRLMGSSGETVPALILTSFIPTNSKIALNLDSGDYATVEERDCACPLGAMGLRTHLSTIRSYEKLTSEGVTFMGSRLYQLVEEVLPNRFGGEVNDYQIAEEEEDGLTRVSIVVSPRVGAVDEDAIVALVLESLQSSHAGGGGALMAEQWRQSNTLRVVRREPYETRTAKVMPLHVLRGGEHASPAPNDASQTSGMSGA